MTDWPLVTIGLPVYNGDRFLKDALQSLVEQTWTNLEIVVVDNASEDETQLIVESFAEKDQRIRYHRAPINRGASWSHNEAVRLARGSLFRLASDDDYWNNEYVEGCVRALMAQEGAVLAYPSTVSWVDETGREVRQPEHLLGHGSEPRPADRFARLIDRFHMCFEIYGLIRIEQLRRTEGIGAYTGSDWVLLAELALHGPFVAAEQAHLYHREHQGRSMNEFPDSRERASWFDPKNAQRRVYPNARLVKELKRAVGRSDLPGVERFSAYRAIVRFARVRWRNFLAELLPAPMAHRARRVWRCLRPIQ